MLLPHELPSFKAKDTELFQVLRDVVESINNLGLQVGIDPKPAPQVKAEQALRPPSQPSAITVSASGGLAFVVVVPAADHNDLTEYLIEVSDTSDFKSYTRYFIGTAHQGLFPFTGISYWRCAAKRPMSSISNYTVFSP